MEIRELDINYYADRMGSGERFAFPGYSDAEWICITGLYPNEKSALGQVLDPAHGQRLLDILKRRQYDPNFMVAIPKVVLSMAWFCDHKLDHFLCDHGVAIIGYERDMVTDDLAAAAGLYPLVRAIKHFNGSRVMIGNHKLSPMHDLLDLTHFFGIDSPNLHIQEDGIEEVVRRVDDSTQITRHNILSPNAQSLFVVSAGVSAAVIIDQLYDRFPKSYFFDCGSMWDAFVGIGAQREWRSKLYADPAALNQWKLDNLYGKAKHSIPEL